jgi:hypothetical protein
MLFILIATVENSTYDSSELKGGLGNSIRWGIVTRPPAEPHGARPSPSRRSTGDKPLFKARKGQAAHTPSFWGAMPASTRFGMGSCSMGPTATRPTGTSTCKRARPPLASLWRSPTATLRATRRRARVPVTREPCRVRPQDNEAAADPTAVCIHSFDQIAGTLARCYSIGRCPPAAFSIAAVSTLQ